MSDCFDHMMDAYDDAYNRGDGYHEDEDNYHNRRTYNKRKHCAYCGKQNLEWSNTTDGWRLRDSNTGEIHKCLTNQKKPVKEPHPMDEYLGDVS